MVKTTGDGVHAAFATAHDALQAALEAQRALVAEQWAVTDALRGSHGRAHRVRRSTATATTSALP